MANGHRKTSAFRQRYWARSYLGYTPVQHAQPNVGHMALAALMRLGYVDQLITQNVDRLHHKAALFGVPPLEKPSFLPHPHILELHGTLKHVHCILCQHMLDRDTFQAELSELNPEWASYAQRMSETGTEPKTNPDGDVDLRDRSYDNFSVPCCPNCKEGILKPTVTFFGESLTPETRNRSHALVASARNVVVVGSALATFSAFRLVREAVDQGKEVGMVNLGVTRADALVSWKIGSSTAETADSPSTLPIPAPPSEDLLGCSKVLRAVGEALVARKDEAGKKVEGEARDMLKAGVMKEVEKWEEEPTS